MGEREADCLGAWKSMDLKLSVCSKENSSFRLNLREEFSLSCCLKESFGFFYMSFVCDQGRLAT